MIRKIFLIIGFILVILIIAYYDLVSYGVDQGLGQLKIVYNAREIEEVIADPTTPDSVKQKLQLVGEIIEFGVSEVGLEDKGNYQTYYDQKGQPSLFVVTAAKPFALEPYEWYFPVVGTMPYKGYFNPQDAEAEKSRVLSLGYDADIRTPGGWSTLGWFNDPVLSNMLSRSEGDLANVILHELTHASIFVKDSVEYNENLASFIGDEATERFLLKKYGRQSEEYKKYHQEIQDFQKFAAHILRGADKLDSLYTKAVDYPVEEKKELKENLISKIINQLDTIQFYDAEQYTWSKKPLPNNTYFMSFLRYQAKQDQFKKQLKKEFDNDLKAYVQFLSEEYD